MPPEGVAVWGITPFHIKYRMAVGERLHREGLAHPRNMSACSTRSLRGALRCLIKRDLTKLGCPWEPAVVWGHDQTLTIA
jgi:hypothetical protein